MSYMNKLEETLRHLVNAINSECSHDEIIKKQKLFTQAVEDAMDSFKKGGITVEVSQALPHVMYNWVVNELPIEIQNISKIRDTRKQLILFQNTITHILHPQEKD